MNKYRHGDVLLTPEKLPDKYQELKTNIVAEGESTGHAHRITNGNLFQAGNVIFVVPGDNTSITHEEHNALTLPRLPEGYGYKRTIQREYDDEQEWREVAD